MFHAKFWARLSKTTLQWRHNERSSVSNHQRLHCLLNCRFRRRSKKTSKLCVTGLFVGNSPVTGEFPALKVSNAENVSIGWRHHVCTYSSWFLLSSWSWSLLPALPLHITMHTIRVLFCCVFIRGQIWPSSGVAVTISSCCTQTGINHKYT